jgi:hypothetical protein
LVLVAQMV